VPKQDLREGDAPCTAPDSPSDLTGPSLCYHQQPLVLITKSTWTICLGDPKDVFFQNTGLVPAVPLPVLTSTGFSFPVLCNAVLEKAVSLLAMRMEQATRKQRMGFQSLSEMQALTHQLPLPCTPIHSRREARATTNTLLVWRQAFLGIIILLLDAFLSCSFKFEIKHQLIWLFFITSAS